MLPFPKARRNTRRDRRESERGSVVVEFLMVFPAFLVLAMFVMEASLMWADRHIERLAAFEAARVFASANLPEFDGQKEYHDPCLAPKVLKRAKQAALRKMAIITPPLPLFLSKLGKAASGINFGVTTDGTNASDAMLRLAKRWPTAVASTELGCSYDPNMKQVKVKLTYHRMLQTPLIDRVIYSVYRLGQVNKSSPVKLSLDENFLSVTADSESLPAVDQLRTAVRDSLKTVQTLGLNANDAVNFMRDVPGVSHVFKHATPAPQDVMAPLNAARGEAQSAINGGLVGSGLDQQSKLLTSLVTMVPEALRRIPMSVSVSLQRDVFSSRAVTAAGAIREAPWNGRIKGVLHMEQGSPYRTFGENLSEFKQGFDLSNGAKGVDQL